MFIIFSIHEDGSMNAFGVSAQNFTAIPEMQKYFKETLPSFSNNNSK